MAALAAAAAVTALAVDPEFEEDMELEDAQLLTTGESKKKFLYIWWMVPSCESCVVWVLGFVFILVSNYKGSDPTRLVRLRRPWRPAEPDRAL